MMRLGSTLANILVCTFSILSTRDYVSTYNLGVGIADITGPPVEVAFMGYAKMDQRGEGLHLRQFSRAFIFDDGVERLVFVTADCGMIGTGVRKAVLQKLSEKFGSLYSERNLMLSGTHTHSAPGGFLMHLIFDLNTLGFVPETFNALVNGMVLSIERAHSRLTKGRIFIARGEVTGANVNRSPQAYLQNPPEERARYKDDVDKTLIQLQLEELNGKPMGVICWFAVHPVSMNNSNRLLSSDNMGFASILFEKKMNPGALVGKGEFIAGFASSNLGDVSPNVEGPRCQISGAPCEGLTSTCPTRGERCVSKGPGQDMFQSTRLIAEKIFKTAWEAWSGERDEIFGPIRVVHQYADMSQMTATVTNRNTGEKIQVRGCQPAMGYSFAAGTTDGPGAFSFKQAMKTTNPLWNVVRNFIGGPSNEQIECQGNKPILLATGEMNFPLEWQPAIVSTQLAFIGQVIIACVPGEFTTMAGRRLRRVLQETVNLESEEQVIIAGLCNTYSDYITTPEEYSLQRYEGASTIYGPYTLTLYLEHFKKMATSSMHRAELTKGPDPPELLNDLISLLPPVLFDTPAWQHNFGDVLEEPPPVVYPGDTVNVTFVSGHPRNNLQHEGTYLTVERLEGSEWKIIATDADWETKFFWERSSFVLGSSEARIEWTIPGSIEPGEYRIRHFGHYKYILGRIEPYEGSSKTFKVVPLHMKNGTESKEV